MILNFGVVIFVGGLISVCNGVGVDLYKLRFNLCVSMVDYTEYQRR